MVVRSADRGHVLGGLAAAAFVLTGGVHITGYGSIVAATADLADLGGELAALMRALWLVFGFHLIALGLVVAFLARLHRPGAAALAVCGCVPLLDAAMQVHFIGFVFPPTVMLAGTAVLTLAASWLSWKRAAAVAVPSAGA